MNPKSKIVLSIAGLLLLVVVTVGTTYAFFTYSKAGTTTNTVTAGNLKFLYTEVSGVGNGISIVDALPVTDTVGKAQSGAGKVFEFKVEGNTPSTASLPYEITAMKTAASTLDESVVKLYLTEVNGTETAAPLTVTGNVVKKYSELQDTTITGAKGKTIYVGEIPANTVNELKNFKLRMWLDEGTDFTTGDYNAKTFTVKVNVYASATASSAS